MTGLFQGTVFAVYIALDIVIIAHCDISHLNGDVFGSSGIQFFRFRDCVASYAHYAPDP